MLCNYFNFICPFNPSEKWLKSGPPLGCLCAYKSSGVLVHLRSSVDGLAEGLLDKLRRGEVGKSLAEVHCFVICCELCELNPVGVRWVRQSNDVTRCVSKNETIRGFVPFQFISVKKIVDFKHPSFYFSLSYTSENLYFRVVASDIYPKIFEGPSLISFLDLWIKKWLLNLKMTGIWHFF